MLSKYILLIFSILIFSIQINGQNDPTFDEFVGTVYKIPIKKVHLGYGKPIHDYEVVGEIRLPELRIPERQDSIKIPGVSLRKSFGIYFKNTMHIPKTGKYAFSLESDDGSILWINGERIINNDKPHKMKKEIGTKILRAGDHPITIWYYQAYPDLYGLIFEAKYLNEVAPEEIPVFSPEGKLTLNNENLNFDSGKYEISEESFAVLEKLAEDLNKIHFQKMIITGHTDDVGNESDNLLLSQKRAEAVADFLKEKITKKGIEFSVFGKGETMPVAPNDTAAGRSKNRRVEFKIE